MKKQVLVIHGGDSFRSYKAYLSFLKSWRINFERYRAPKIGWKRNLAKSLGNKYEVILVDMPSKINAKYAEWKTWFEKFIPHLRPGVILVGHSLGGLFLVKYLSENKFPKKILAVFLVAAPTGEGDFTMPKTLKKMETQGGMVFLYQSKDDRVVAYKNFGHYKRQLPNAITRVFKNRGHFNQEVFPELADDIRSLLS